MEKGKGKGKEYHYYQHNKTLTSEQGMENHNDKCHAKFFLEKKKIRTCAPFARP